MICDICQKNNATVHLTEIINDKVVEMHICQGCAQAKAAKFKDQLSISNLLGGFMEKGHAHHAEKVLQCNFCGMTYNDFKKYGRFGCGNCYTVFKGRLMSLLRNIHGSVRYAGKAPAGSAKKVSVEAQITDMKDRLAQAIGLENYEEAARLRDEIKKLESKRKDV